jgi:AcrR family transcriptional regulator
MSHDTIPEDPEPSSATGGSDLRLRKRIRTKQMVQREALALFADKGYDQTTVDDIAHAATMSPRTFFRYFPTKEDVVLWDEYDERPLQDVWRARPGEDPFAQLILWVREVIADIYHKDPELLLARIKLSFTVPEIRARFLDEQMTTVGPYLDQLADAIGAPRDDLRLPVTMAALFSAMLVAIERWQRHDGRDDLLRLFDDAVAALAGGAADLRDTVQAAAVAGARPAKPRAGAAKRRGRVSRPSGGAPAAPRGRSAH